MRAVNESPVTARPVPDAELRTLEFLSAWAHAHRASAPSSARRAREDAPMPPEIAFVARHAASLLGDRPLRAVTLGELARLPRGLEEYGMSRRSAFVACRALGAALRRVIVEATRPGGAAPRE